MLSGKTILAQLLIRIPLNQQTTHKLAKLQEKESEMEAMKNDIAEIKKLLKGLSKK